MKWLAFGVHSVGVWMHTFAKLGWWIVLSAVCKSRRFHYGIYNRFLIKRLAHLGTFCRHVCVRMFATLGLWIVVACLWLVKACFLMCVSMIDFGMNWCAMCVRVVCMWMRMFATLGSWNVVACLWFVKCCFFKLCIFYRC